MIAKCLLCKGKIKPWEKYENWYKCSDCGVILYGSWSSETILAYYSQLRDALHKPIVRMG